MTRPGGVGGLDALRDAFLTHIRLERGLAQKTVEAYAGDLERFLESARAQGVVSPAELRRETVVAYIGDLESTGLGPRSRARALSALRRMLAFAASRGELEHDPMEGILGPRVAATLPRLIRPDETAALVAAVDVSTPLGLRDRAMVELLYGAGLRVSELVGLPVSALDLRGGLLRVVGKGSKERVVPVGEEALRAVDVYLQEVALRSWGRGQIEAGDSS